MKKFASSLDQTSVVITTLMIVISLSVFVTGYISYKKSGGEPMVLVFTSLTAVFLCLIVIALYLLRTTAIIVSSDGITIERAIKPVNLSYANIKSIQLLQKGEMGIAVRTFGNGGVFGYTGMYYTKKHGSMTWYCTRRSGYILIERTNGRKLVITPDDSSGVINDIRALRPALLLNN